MTLSLVVSSVSLCLLGVVLRQAPICNVQLRGDPHFDCPGTGTSFDFDGKQSLDEPVEAYRLVADPVTGEQVNIELTTHLFKLEPAELVQFLIASKMAYLLDNTNKKHKMQHLYTHTTRISVQTRMRGGSELLRLDLFFEESAAVPSLHLNGMPVDLEDKLVQSFLHVKYHVCDYMQPASYILSQYVGKDYVYSKTSHDCTFLKITLSDSELDIVAVPAKLEEDGVGINYFNLGMPSWHHSKEVEGILSHCYDTKVTTSGQCDACLNDTVTSMNQFKQMPRQQKRKQLQTAGSVGIQSDHRFHAVSKKSITDAGDLFKFSN